MNLNNKTIIDLAKLNIINKEKLDYNANVLEKDIVYEENNSITNENSKYKVILDGITDEDLPLMIMVEQLKNIRTIKNIAIFFAVLAGISLAASIVSAISIANLF